MAKTKKAQSNRVQLRAFVAGQDTFIERQVFDSREAALAYLSAAARTHGLLLNRPQEGGVTEGDDSYVMWLPWRLISGVDIIGYAEKEDRCG